MKEGLTRIESLSFSSDFSNVGLVEDLVNRVCEKLSIDEELYGNVLIALTEAVNNAIDHGNRQDRNLEVFIDVVQNDNQFGFVVKDMGRGFDFDNLPDPTAPENILKENGRGIFLMKNLADEVEFEDSGRTVHIMFNV